MSTVTNTLNYLRRLRAARAEGYRGSYTTDPRWLVNMAINRRAGWPDDPSLLRGSAMPVKGRYPKRSSGEGWRMLCLVAREVNTPRLIVRRARCGGLDHRVLARLTARLSA